MSSCDIISYLSARERPIINIRVFRLRTLVKANVPIWNTSEKQYYWQDKAGGYGIQEPFGMKHIKRIDGDYYNVVGLPISKLYHLLKKEFNISI